MTKIDPEENLILVQVIPIDIVNIIIGFGISACAYGVVVFAFFQRRKNESVIDNKIEEVQLVKKDAAGSDDPPHLLFTLDEVEKIILGEDEIGQTHAREVDENADLRSLNSDNASLLSTLNEVEKIIYGEDENGKIHEPVKGLRPPLFV